MKTGGGEDGNLLVIAAPTSQHVNGSSLGFTLILWLFGLGPDIVIESLERKKYIKLHITLKITMSYLKKEEKVCQYSSMQPLLSTFCCIRFSK